VEQLIQTGRTMELGQGSVDGHHVESRFSLQNPTIELLDRPNLSRQDLDGGQSLNGLSDVKQVQVST